MLIALATERQCGRDRYGEAHRATGSESYRRTESVNP